MNDMEEVYMGFVGVANCKECGKETFAADEVCYSCKEEEAEAERLSFLGLKISDCE